MSNLIKYLRRKSIVTLVTSGANILLLEAAQE